MTNGVMLDVSTPCSERKKDFSSSDWQRTGWRLASQARLESQPAARSQANRTAGSGSTSSGKLLAQHPRGTPFYAPESAAEIRVVIEAHAKRDLQDTQVGVCEQLGSCSDTEFVDVGCQSPSSGPFEKSAQRRLVHRNLCSELCEVRFVVEMSLQVCANFFNSLLIPDTADWLEADRGEPPGSPRFSEVYENSQQGNQTPGRGERGEMDQLSGNIQAARSTIESQTMCRLLKKSGDLRHFL